MRIKGEDNSFQIICASAFRHTVKNLLMTQVHAVKITDGHDGALARVAEALDPSIGRVCDIQAQSWCEAHAVFQIIGEHQTCTSNFKPSKDNCTPFGNFALACSWPRS